MHFAIASIVLSSTVGADQAGGLNLSLQKYVEARVAEFDQIPNERKAQLVKLAEYVRSRNQSNHPARLTFICTHNSRRSHLAQVWAQTAATYYDVAGVETFSGGTESTAFNARAVNALKRAGFDIGESPSADAVNPRYQVRFHDKAPAVECFSKVYDQKPNPPQDFCAVMTCSQADQACPVVAGAALRIAIPYEDPKAFDETPEEGERYDERCRQIAREMLYVLSKV